MIRFLIETWDRWVASDPGLTRLRLAGSAAVGVATTLGIEYLFATFIHAGSKATLISMLFGAIVAMIGMMALNGPERWAKIRTAVFFPVALGVGLVCGVVVRGNTDLMLIVFVVIMFVAVIIRRFGIPFFFYGFMGWIGYFFSSFMRATFAQLPSLLVAIGVATVWVMLLSVTVLRTNPARTLKRTIHTFDARTRAVARACTDLLRSQHGRQRDRMLQRLHTRQGQLSEAALMIEGWSAERGSLPADRSAPALRRHVMNAQHVVDRLVASAEILVESPPRVRTAAAKITDQLAQRDDAGAIRFARQLSHTAADLDLDEKEKFAFDVFLDMTIECAELGLSTVFDDLDERIQIERDTSQDDDTVDEFNPVVGLFMGNLPGSPAVARDVPAVGTRWNPLARLDMTTRQAIQVAIAGGLAILFGRMLSPTRYYWAVIAAFIMFTGTATRTETFLKGLNRVIGTLFGLVAAIWLAEQTAGHPAFVVVVVVCSIFLGLYLMRVSYAYMIFFITIMIGQLYSILHMFSTGLLVLRLEETVIGAAAGFVVAVVVTPLSTQDTVRAARNNLLHDLALFLRRAVEAWQGRGTSDVELDEQALTLDNRIQQLATVARPLTRPFVWGYSPRVRHRLALYASLTTGVRGIAVTIREDAPKYESHIADKFRELADSAEEFAEHGSKKAQHSSELGPSGNGSAANGSASKGPSEKRSAAKRSSQKRASRKRRASDDESVFDMLSRDPANDPRERPVVRRLFHVASILHELEANPADPL